MQYRIALSVRASSSTAYWLRGSLPAYRCVKKDDEALLPHKWDAAGYVMQDFASP